MLTDNDLVRIEYQLPERDREILRTLKATKCLFTYHIRRLFFYDLKNKSSATRITQKSLKRLKDFGLIDVLVDRRIGGIRAGSSSYIWYLTEQGHRLLNLNQKYEDKKPKRTRFLEPAYSTLGHRMAINECFIQLKELEHEGLLDVDEALFEPTNWHCFTYHGKSEILKPDLSIVTTHHDLEYRFFIEMDLSTESIDTIKDKCDRYHKYLLTGEQQDEYGVFPIVLWIVKDEKRKQKMEEALRKHFKKHPNIFLIIIADQFTHLMTSPTIPAEELC